MRRSKKTKRPVNNEFGLYKELVRKNARDFVDFDYVDCLDNKAREWLAKFSAEFYQSRFKNDGSDLLPQGSEERKQHYAANNARNRDLWTQFDRRETDETPASNNTRADALEDNILEVIDSEKWDD